MMINIAHSIPAFLHRQDALHAEMKIIRLSTLALSFCLSLSFMDATVAKEKNEDSDSEAESDVTIQKTMLAKKTDEGYEPVKSFDPDDSFAVIVELSEAKVGTKLKAVWTIVDAGGKQEEKILEKKIEITAEAIKGVDQPNRINFSLTHDDPMPSGEYKAEIYLNGELAKTVKFKVK